MFDREPIAKNNAGGKAVNHIGLVSARRIGDLDRHI
jgi:hypothetical protein